jgi:translation initiation factor eIF-2B subunit delta
MSTAIEPPARPPQKSMTKAERRELQEKQRAAKLAQKQQQQGQSAPSPAKSKQPASSKKQDVSKSSQSAPVPSKDTTKDQTGDSGSDRNGLQIFSHFSQPKPIGQGVKGVIHPAIIRLGLHFAEFKICGANARCIATLTTFKQVFILS